MAVLRGNVTYTPIEGVIGILLNGVVIHGIGIKQNISGEQVWTDAKNAAGSIEDFCGGFTDENGIYHVMNF